MADDMPPSLDDDIPPSLDDDIPPELEDDDDITPSMEDAAEGSAGAEGPSLREQMLSASEGAIQKKKEARKKEEKKVTKNFGKESFKKGFLAAAKSNYSVGTMVELHSLSSTSLNGRVGKCGKYDEKEGRYAVTLLATKTKKKKKVAVRPTNLRRAQDPDVIRPKKESEKKNPLQFDEVQEALKATQKLQNDKSWVTPELLKKIASNPKLAGIMQDPRFPQLMHAMQHNPGAVAEKAKTDPSLKEFLESFTQLMGSHFTGLGEKQRKDAEEEAKREQEQLKKQRESAVKAAAAKSTPDVQKILNNPELVKLLQEMKEGSLQAVLQECSSNPRALQNYMRNDEIGPKLRKLIDAGLLRFG